jgi:AtzE family amidohydrolase
MTSATTLAAAIRARRRSAAEVTEAALSAIAAGNPALNAFTDITADRARAEAASVDAAIAAGRDPGPLAGVPVAVKNLFDVAGLPTRAGSRINRDLPAATRDAFALRRLRAAGAVLVGATNMDEYAFGFTTENSHDGPARNPHDPSRIAGGSSGGSAVAVAAGMVPVALGTDTNGSIRVPAALCGVFGLKPSYGRLSRAGAFPFVASFDHVGPLARDLADLALAYDALQGEDPDDPAQAPRPAEPILPHLEAGIAGLRIAVADGHFAAGAVPEALAAVAEAARLLGATRRVTLQEAARARAAAVLITLAESGSLHLPNLRSRPDDFDPLIRDRLLAGALLPAHWITEAQRHRARARAEALAAFREVDLILTPCLPHRATPIGQAEIEIDGVRGPLRPGLGVFAQPISCIGLPAISVPLAEPGGLPLAIQIVAAPWREDLLFRAARVLERAGFAGSPPPP